MKLMVAEDRREDCRLVRLWNFARELKAFELRPPFEAHVLLIATIIKRTSYKVKGFGCRQAYESLSCRNPRATVDGYGDFDLRSMSAMARPPAKACCV